MIRAFVKKELQKKTQKNFLFFFSIRLHQLKNNMAFINIFEIFYVPFKKNFRFKFFSTKETTDEGVNKHFLKKKTTMVP